MQMDHRFPRLASASSASNLGGIGSTNPFAPGASPRRDGSITEDFRRSQRNLQRINSAGYILNESLNNLRRLTLHTANDDEDYNLSPSSMNGEDVFNNVPISGSRSIPLHEKLAEVRQQIKRLREKDKISAFDLADRIAETFQNYGMNTIQTIEGEDVVRRFLKFCICVNISHAIDEKEEERLNRLRKALLKECGFSIRARVIPVITYRGTGDRDVNITILVNAINMKQHSIIFDSRGRVFQDICDWKKNNDLPIHTKYVVCWFSQNPPDVDCLLGGRPVQGFTLKKLAGSSTRKRRYKWHIVDAVVAVGAISAGVLCVATGGTILLPLIAGEAVAVAYMGYRGGLTIRKKRSHRPKMRS